MLWTFIYTIGDNFQTKKFQIVRKSITEWRTHQLRVFVKKIGFKINEVEEKIWMENVEEWIGRRKQDLVKKRFISELPLIETRNHAEREREKESNVFEIEMKWNWNEEEEFRVNLKKRFWKKVKWNEMKMRVKWSPNEVVSGSTGKPGETVREKTGKKVFWRK